MRRQPGKPGRSAGRRCRGPQGQTRSAKTIAPYTLYQMKAVMQHRRMGERWELSVEAQSSDGMSGCRIRPVARGMGDRQTGYDRVEADRMDLRQIHHRQELKRLLVTELVERISRTLHAGIEEIRRRSEEHTSELQSRENLVCRLLLEKKKK